MYFRCYNSEGHDWECLWLGFWILEIFPVYGVVLHVYVNMCEYRNQMSTGAKLKSYPTFSAAEFLVGQELTASARLKGQGESPSSLHSWQQITSI